MKRHREETRRIGVEEYNRTEARLVRQETERQAATDRRQEVTQAGMDRRQEKTQLGAKTRLETSLAQDQGQHDSMFGLRKRQLAATELRNFNTAKHDAEGRLAQKRFTAATEGMEIKKKLDADPTNKSLQKQLAQKVNELNSAISNGISVKEGSVKFNPKDGTTSLVELHELENREVPVTLTGRDLDNLFNQGMLSTNALINFKNMTKMDASLEAASVKDVVDGPKLEIGKSGKVKPYNNFYYRGKDGHPTREKKYNGKSLTPEQIINSGNDEYIQEYGKIVNGKAVIANAERKLKEAGLPLTKKEDYMMFIAEEPAFAKKAIGRAEQLMKAQGYLSTNQKLKLSDEGEYQVFDILSGVDADGTRMGPDELALNLGATGAVEHAFSELARSLQKERRLLKKYGEEVDENALLDKHFQNPSQSWLDNFIPRSKVIAAEAILKEKEWEGKTSHEKIAMARQRVKDQAAKAAEKKKKPKTKKNMPVSVKTVDRIGRKGARGVQGIERVLGKVPKRTERKGTPIGAAVKKGVEAVKTSVSENRAITKLTDKGFTMPEAHELIKRYGIKVKDMTLQQINELTK